MNYIEFLKENNILIAKIHIDGKLRTVKSQNNFNKLLNICNEYGYNIKPPCYIEKYVQQINIEYLEYLLDKKKKNDKLNIFTDKLTSFKLSKTNPLKNKKLVATTLSLILVSSVATSLNEKTNDIQEQNHKVIETIEENPVEQDNNHDTIELEEMLNSNEFHFSYEDRTENKSINNAYRYKDLFEKYGKMYGIDSNLLMALAAQESSGEHFNNIGSNPAEGIMQIEKAVHIGRNISAYNFETGKIDTIKVTSENLKDLDINIQVGTMILREYIEANNYNIPLALQTYNFGPGNMSNSLDMCSDLEGISKDKLKNNQSNNSWLKYRAFLHTGDPEYVEHVFSYLNNHTEISVLDRDNGIHSVFLVNDYQKVNNI